MILMSLGSFVFSINSTTYDSLTKSHTWNHPSQKRVGNRPSSQFLGFDDTTLKISGSLIPQINGPAMTLDFLVELADKGKPLPLIDNSGKVLGAYVITNIEKTSNVIGPAGVELKIDFSISLKEINS